MSSGPHHQIIAERTHWAGRRSPPAALARGASGGPKTIGSALATGIAGTAKVVLGCVYFPAHLLLKLG